MWWLLKWIVPRGAPLSTDAWPDPKWIKLCGRYERLTVSDPKWTGQQQNVTWIQTLLPQAIWFLSWQARAVPSVSVGGLEKLVKMVSLLPSFSSNALRGHLHHALDPRQNWAEVYMVDIFDESKHASSCDPPAAWDGSCDKGFQKSTEWSQFTVKYKEPRSNVDDAKDCISRMGFLEKTSWLLANTTNGICPVVTIFYWTFLFPTLEVPLSFEITFLHLFNTLW